jgi:hypothetical protein
MKWFIPIVVSIVLIGVANGDSIKINATDAGGGRLLVGYEVTSGTTLPVGFGLNIQLNNQATFGSVVSASTYFPIYPGSVQIQGGQIVNDGSPIAAYTYPGTLPGLGSSGVTVEMGVEGFPITLGSQDPRDFNFDAQINNSDLGIFVTDWLEYDPYFAPTGDLDGDSDVDLVDYGLFVDNRYNAPPTSLSNLLLLQLNGNGAASTNVTISLNTTRGGIVGEGDSYLNIILPDPVTVVVPEPATLLLLGLGAVMVRKH